MRTAAAFVLFVGSPLAAGAIGAIASVSAPQLYRALDAPSWAPPASVFGPVWTTLYLLMGIAAFLVWKTHDPRARGALTLFLLHLPFNALWSWLFFAWQLGTASIIDIVALWLMIAALVVRFHGLRRVAAWLLVPYLLWVTYATALNIALVQRNAAL